MLKFCFDLKSTEQQSHRFFFRRFFPPSVEKNVFDERYRFWEPAALNADSEDNEDKQTDEDDLSDVTVLPGPAFVQLVRADVQPELEGLFDRHRGCRRRFKVDATFEDQFQFKVLSHSIVTTSSRRRRLSEVQLVWRHSLTFGRAFLLWSIRWVSASIFFLLVEWLPRLVSSSILLIFRPPDARHDADVDVDVGEEKKNEKAGWKRCRYRETERVERGRGESNWHY